MFLHCPLTTDSTFPPPTNMKKMLAGIWTPAILDLRSHAPWNYQAEGTHTWGKPAGVSHQHSDGAGP